MSDLFKDTPLRYAAFANDFGEVFRNIIGNRMANFTYGVTAAYALGDVYQTYQKQLPDRVLAKKEAVDCAVWQLFASILITPILLKGGCVGLTRIIQKRALAPGIKKYLPPVATLTTIPVLAPYVDQKVDDIMDNYYRSQPKKRVHHSLWH